ncbi:MAG TPA: polysaccharide deacetylase [Clostridium sp.]|nr:polysaccharide deacetylase [Clostridium sp.]
MKIKKHNIVICIVALLCIGAAGYLAYDKLYGRDATTNNIHMSVLEKVRSRVEAELLDLNFMGGFDKEDGQVINDDRGIPVIGYHSIGYDPTGKNPLVVSPEKFKEQLQKLVEKGYTTLTMEQVQNYLINDNPIPAKSVLLTFDDGYEDNYTNAFPILKEFNMNATIFVIPGYLDGGVYLSRDQVKEMSSSGLIDIESHTYSHKRLNELSYNEQLKELVSSKKALSDLIGKEVTAIAYPEGLYNDDTLKAVAEAGYKTGFTIDRGYADRGDNVYKLNRVCVDNTYSGKNILYVLKCIKK